MTDDAVIIGPEAWDIANAIVGQHLLRRDIAVALLHDVARAVQIELNRAELAEAERTQAVATMRSLAERLRVLADTAVIEAWFTCPRCGMRGPHADELTHAQGCALSSRPPPRLSLVAPTTETKP